MQGKLYVRAVVYRGSFMYVQDFHLYLQVNAMKVVYMGIFIQKQLFVRAEFFIFFLMLQVNMSFFFSSYNSISHSILLDFLTFALNIPESFFVSKLVWITKKLGLWSTHTLHFCAPVSLRF